MKNILTAVLLLLSISFFSQERRELKDGKEYIIHSVKKGETLYGISKKYNVTKKQLRKSNSGMLLFIKTDQEINVPIPDKDRTIHVVKKGETLYGIAKQYNMTTEQLVLLNPEKSVALIPGHLLILKVEKKAPVYEKAKVDGHIKTQGEKVLKEEKEPVKQTPKKVAEKVVSKLSKGNLHEVKKGETLYGIARQYGITVSELLKLNPQIKNNSISIGDKINVPSSTKTIEVKDPVKTVNVAKIVQYKVEKGETLYGISKKFNTTVEEIQKLNPEISSLKEGDLLKINVPEKGTNQIEIDLGNPNSTDTLRLNEVNKINPLKDKLIDMVQKEKYIVSLFLPFMLDKNDQTPVVPNKPKKMNPLTEMSTHFYQGALLGLDSAKASGISIDLNVYDTEKDTNTVNKLLRKEKVKSSDLIVGPFFEKPYKQVAKFAKINEVQAISPVLKNNFVLFNNQFVTQIETSLPTQLTYLATYIAENKNTENVICVSGKSKQEKYLDGVFKDKYNKQIAGKTNNYRSTCGEYKMTSYSSIRGFDTKLVKGKKNILIIPFTDEGMASSFFTQLHNMMTRSRMKGYEIEVYALENFMEYENINVDLKMKYNLHVTSSNYINYKEEKVKSFVRKYRVKFGTEPSKYAFVGYDVAFYHALAMSNYGKRFSGFYGQIKVPLLQSNYNLKKTDIASGYENQSVYILGYKEYSLVQVN
ncbi:MAG: LysM peptidoglycan-binding domain-containing protein [Flavobacteriales bacterium]